MGYDMYVVDSDGKMLDESTLNVDWDSTDEQWRAEEERRWESHTYLRRSMGNMSRLITALVEAGMAYSSVNPPSFPPYPGDEHFDTSGDWEPVTEQARQYRKQCADTLVKTGDERPGIPIHKFSSNDGWWVTPPECRSAMQLWAREGSPMKEEFRDDVIPFLLKAAQNGGFRVW
jgi:hypothetical protein